MTCDAYGRQLVRRLGQGSFRLLVTDAYGRRCAVSGEKTLPVLEAAHIRPFKERGPHKIANGLLLRADLHKLFDSGLITATKDLRLSVSPKIREELQNGKEYYRFHGSPLQHLPRSAEERPGAGGVGRVHISGPSFLTILFAIPDFGCSIRWFAG